MAAGKRYYGVSLPGEARGVYLAFWGSLAGQIRGVRAKRHVSEQAARVWLAAHGHHVAAHAPLRVL